MWEIWWYLLSERSWNHGGPCVDLCACACVHPFMKLWNSYKGSLNRPALPGKEKLEGSNSKITLNHMSWLIKITCCMNLKAGKKNLSLYATFLALKTHLREATFHSDTGAVLIITVLSIKIIWNQEQFNF